MREESKNDVVKEARELLAKATPGPWEVYPDSRPDIMTTAKVNSGYMGERHLLSMDKYGSAWGQDFDSEDDANLIARAPYLLSALCDEVDRLQAALGTIADPPVDACDYLRLRDIARAALHPQQQGTN